MLISEFDSKTTLKNVTTIFIIIFISTTLILLTPVNKANSQTSSWIQTTKEDFESGQGVNMDTSSPLGDVTLSAEVDFSKLPIILGEKNTAGRKDLDNTFVAVGYNGFNELGFTNWDGVLDVDIGKYFSLILLNTGEVKALGWNDMGQLDVQGWTDIADIEAGRDFSLGLKTNGTVIGVGNNENGQLNINSWENIAAIEGGQTHTVGLKKDGTVLAIGNSIYEQLDVSGWKNIKAIAADYNHTVGLRKDDPSTPINENGTVVAVGNNSNGQTEVYGWTDIKAISAGAFHTIGLKADGTVVATGGNQYGQCNVSAWENIAAISAGGYHTVGLTKDGKVLATGRNNFNQCDVQSWPTIKQPTYIYSSNGALISSILDTNQQSAFKTIEWDADVPANTDVKFQIATNNNNATWNFVGPDGTPDTYYTTSGQTIWEGHSGDRYIKYKAYLSTNDTTITPTLEEVRISYGPYDTTPPNGAIIINNDAEFTNNELVALTIFATDDNPNADISMRFSNDAANWSDWEPYNNSRDWILSPGDGKKVVYAQFKDSAGNISNTSFTFTSEDDWNGTNQGVSTTLSNIDLLDTPGDVKIASQGEALDIGNGADGDYVLSSNKTIKEIYETDLGHGIGSYNPSEEAVPNFNNFIITSTGILATNSLVAIDLKVKETLNINLGGKIDASGMGYSGGAGGTYSTGGKGGDGSGTGGGIGGYGWMGGGWGGGSPGGGGGYGSNGGDGRGDFKWYLTNKRVGIGGLAYGAYPFNMPTFGSGGGGGGNFNGLNSINNPGSPGGNGGGLIKIQVSSAVINGQIVSNGINGSDGLLYSIPGASGIGAAGAGGSGGGIFINSANSINNLSSIHANGGNGGVGDGGNIGGAWYAGGGAGGRIVIRTPEISGTPSLSGGSGYMNGGNGIFEHVIPYYNSAVLGGAGTGLRAGDPSGTPQAWSGVFWSASNLSAVNKIRIQARVGDTWGTGDEGYMPLDQESTDNALWTELSSGNTGAIRITNPNLLNLSKTMEIRLELLGDGKETPILNDLTVNSTISDTIILDQTPPNEFSLISPANNSQNSDEIVTFVWEPTTDPIVNKVNSGIAKYQLFIDDELVQDNIPANSTETSVAAPQGKESINWFVRAYDNAGNYRDSDIFTVIRDSIPPITTAVVSGDNSFNYDWFKSDVFVTLNAEDNPGGSGVKETYYTVDAITNSVSLTPYSFPITQEGINVLSYWSVDNAGNTEFPNFKEIKIDKTSPTANYVITGNKFGEWYKSAKIELNASDKAGGSGIQNIFYRLDGNDTQAYDSNNQINVSTHGSHTLIFYAIDYAGNKSDTKEVQFKVDSKGPDITIYYPEPRDYIIPEDIPIKYTVTDDATGVYEDKAWIDTSFVENNTSTSSLNFPTGDHIFKVRATDNLGNETIKTVDFRTLPPDAVGPPKFSTCNNQGPYADKVISYSVAGNINNSRPIGTTANTLGVPDGLTRGLGTYGSDVIVEFTDNKAVEGDGADLAIYAEDYLYKAYVKSDDMVDFQPIEDPNKSYKGNVQIDFNGKFDNVTQVKIVSNSALYGAKIDAVQAIHPGPYVDFVNNNGSINPELALGPKDNRYTVITAAYGITHSVNLAFTDNLAVDGGGYDLIIYGNEFSGNYKLSIREDFDTMTYTPIGTFKGIQSIDLANYDISQAVEVKIEAVSPKTAIDAIEAIHTGPYADKIIFSNVKKPDISAANLNNFLGAKDNQYASLFLRQFVEVQFVDNQVINRDGPDIAIYASQEHWSEPYKVYVKENAANDEWIDIKPEGSFTKYNTNISLPENIQKVEVLKIVGNGAFEAAKIDAIEALHSDKDEVITSISSDYDVYPVGSDASITASFTPCDTKLESINMEVIINGIQTDYDDVPVEDGFTSYRAINFSDIQQGKNTIVVRSLNDNNEPLGESNYAVYGGLTEAMNILGKGSALRLSDGTFNGPFTINKNLYMQGANTSTNYQKSIAYPDKTIIEGPNSGTTIDIKADYVELYGLTISGGDCAVYTNGTKGLQTKFNNIRKYNEFGVYVLNSAKDITGDLPEPDSAGIAWNYIDTERIIDCGSVTKKVSGKIIPIISSPNGVKIVNSNVNYVQSNTIKNNVTGVKLVQSRAYVGWNSLIANCISIYKDPIDEEIIQDAIQGNEITDTELGIVFSQSDNIHLNIFENVISNAKVGILGMAGSADIYNNQISDSDVGIFAPLPFVNIHDNVFSNNLQDNPSTLPPEIKQVINDEILESIINEPYYLSELIAGYNLESGIANSLNTKLKNISLNLFDALDYMGTNKKLAVNNLNTAINNIAAFQNEVKGLNENKMNQSQKDTLTVLSEILKRQVSYIKNNI